MKVNLGGLIYLSWVLRGGSSREVMVLFDLETFRKRLENIYQHIGRSFGNSWGIKRSMSLDYRSQWNMVGRHRMHRKESAQPFEPSIYGAVLFRF